MPKKYGHFYNTIADAENGEVAITNASLGKRDRSDVKKILENKVEYAMALETLLRTKCFQPSPSIHLIIKDGPHKKEREIVIPKFYPDQCVHWMLMQQIQPIIMKGMYEYNCGSIPGRGSKYALDAIHYWLTYDPKNCTWCMKLDVEKFYQNIDHECLKKMFRHVIKDPDVLWLLDTVIDCIEQGVPIGYYTSQWFANFYLQSIDHYIKEVLKIPHYVRYMDDMLLMASSKRQLIRAKQSIEAELAKIGLKIRNNIDNPAKKNWEIFKPRETGLEFIGTKFIPIKVSKDKHRYIWMRVMSRDTMLRMSRRAKRIHRKGSMDYSDACAVVSYYGIARSGNNWRFECKYLRPYVDFEKAKKVVSVESKNLRASGKPLRHPQNRQRIVRCYSGGNRLGQPQPG